MRDIEGQTRECVLILGEKHAIKYFKDILLKYISLKNVLIEKNKTLSGRANNESFG